MKFNRELLSAALPEWRLFFIDYVRLKSLVRKATTPGISSADAEVNDSAFWDALEDELQKVSRFHTQKVEWARSQLGILEEAVAVLEATSPSDKTRDGAAEAATPAASDPAAPASPAQPATRVTHDDATADVVPQHTVLASAAAERAQLSYSCVDSVLPSAVRPELSSLQTTPDRSTIAARARAHASAAKNAAAARLRGVGGSAPCLLEATDQTVGSQGAVERSVVDGDGGTTDAGPDPYGDGDGDGDGLNDADSIFGGSEAPSLMSSPAFGAMAGPPLPGHQAGTLSLGRASGGAHRLAQRSIQAHRQRAADTVAAAADALAGFSLDGPGPADGSSGGLGPGPRTTARPGIPQAFLAQAQGHRVDTNAGLRRYRSDGDSMLRSVIDRTDGHPSGTPQGHRVDMSHSPGPGHDDQDRDVFRDRYDDTLSVDSGTASIFDTPGRSIGRNSFGSFSMGPGSASGYGHASFGPGSAQSAGHGGAAGSASRPPPYRVSLGGSVVLGQRTAPRSADVGVRATALNQQAQAFPAAAGPDDATRTPAQTTAQAPGSAMLSIATGPRVPPLSFSSAAHRHLNSTAERVAALPASHAKVSNLTGGHGHGHTSSTASAVRHFRAFFTEGVDADRIVSVDQDTGAVSAPPGVASPRVMLSPRMNRHRQDRDSKERGEEGLHAHGSASVDAPSSPIALPGSVGPQQQAVHQLSVSGAAMAQGADEDGRPRKLFHEHDGGLAGAVDIQHGAGAGEGGLGNSPVLAACTAASSVSTTTPAASTSASGSGSDTPSLLHFADPKGGVDDYRLRFARVKKAAEDASRELELLAQYLHLNDTAVYKATKKRDKQLRLAGMLEEPPLGRGWPGATPLMQAYLTELHAPSSPYAFLRGLSVRGLQERAKSVLARLAGLEPGARAWKRTKVYSIGCFDTFHHGHANLLKSLRSFGRTVVVGIHDDASYQLLKGSLPVDSLESRMAAIRPYTDQVFVIPSTDPTPYLAAAVAPVDLAEGRAVYVRGDDMPSFPARTWCETHGMPIYLLPRTQAVSSTYIKAVYGHTAGGGTPSTNGQDGEAAGKAGAEAEGGTALGTPGPPTDRLRLAFAATDYQAVHHTQAIGPGPSTP